MDRNAADYDRYHSGPDGDEMTQDEYNAISGRYAAEFDMNDGKPGYHRNASNSPHYMRAYDMTLAQLQKESK